MKKILIFILVAACLAFSSCGMANGNSKENNGAHTVRFNSNGGSAVASLESERLETAPKPTKEGYFFCGWYLDKDLKNPVVYPMTVAKDTTLYAMWTKETDQITVDNASVKFDVENEYSYSAMRNIFPSGFDIRALAANGHSIQIDVTYEVYYAKDYDVAFDLGYMGAPDHEVGILDDHDEGSVWENLPTTTEPQTKSVSTVIKAADLLDTSITLKLFTYNLQNIVYFQNIVVNYKCVE